MGWGGRCGLAGAGWGELEGSGWGGVHIGRARGSAWVGAAEVWLPLPALPYALQVSGRIVWKLPGPTSRHALDRVMPKVSQVQQGEPILID